MPRAPPAVRDGGVAGGVLMAASALGARVLATHAPVARRELVRLGSFAALAVFGALHWATLVSPGAPGAMVAMVAAVIAGGAALAWSAGRQRVRQAGATAAGILVGVVLLLAAGVPSGLLDPRSWADLASGIREGVNGMPAAAIPYQGVDEWVRTCILLGGGLLLALAAALAFAPRSRGALGRPLLAAVVLAAVYAIPAVERDPSRPFLGGAVFAVLLAAFLWLERLSRAQLPLAAVLVVAAAGGGVLAAPSLDGSRPWIDYEHLAVSIAESRGRTFSWDHTYGTLAWPRDGREVLRIKARGASYWKTENLDDFNGVRWRHSLALDPSAGDTEIARTHPDWIEQLQVTVRGLRSAQFVGAGTTLAIDRSPRHVDAVGPGAFVTGGAPLRSGDSYEATVYTPRPDVLELAGSGHRYPPLTAPYLTMNLPPVAGGPSAPAKPGADSLDLATEIDFSPWGDPSPPLAIRASNHTDRGGAALLARSRYARMYAFARRLKHESSSPYQFVRRVERVFSKGFRYNEAPPQHELPLPAFLFADREGYCQQFSGTMALLLRMGGVPARVATGFAPGTFDRKRGDYVVRDVDAHSWVEAYFPGLGWVPFDPTPAIAPPRSQVSTAADTSAAGADRVGTGRAQGQRRGGGTSAVAVGGGGGVPVALLVAGGGLVASLAAAVAVASLRRRRRTRELGGAEDRHLAELRLALEGTGRAASPALTLARLETLLGGGTSEAGAYVKAVRLRRYGLGGPGPTVRQRSALRRELAAGLGVVGRVRAWWALPPLGPHRRRAYTAT